MRSWFVKLVFVLLLIPGIALATIYAPKQYAPGVYPIFYTDLPWFDTPLEACDAGFLRRQMDWSFPPWSVVKGSPYIDTNSGQPNGCRVVRLRNGETGWGEQGFSLWSRIGPCPQNSFSGQAAGTCTCVAPYVESDGQCRRPPPCPEGEHEEGGACVPDHCKPHEIRVAGFCVPSPPEPPEPPAAPEPPQPPTFPEPPNPPEPPTGPDQPPPPYPPEPNNPNNNDMCRPSGTSEGSPIAPAIGAKVRSETDWTSPRSSGLHFTRYYQSSWGLEGGFSASALGIAWRHSHEIELSQQPNSSGLTMFVIMGEGHMRAFNQTGGTGPWVAVGHSDTLSVNGSGQWIYRRADRDETLTFNGTGKIVSKTLRNGWQTIYAYDGSNRLSTVTDHFGQVLVFGYSTANQLTSVTAPGGQVIAYGYDSAGRLNQVQHADGTSRSFLYENASFPYALTGIVDETGTRWGTFGYDSTGRATTTELAGSVKRYQVSYPSTVGGPTTVVDPLGAVRNFQYKIVNGKLVVVGADKPDAFGRPDAASRTQNSLGLTTAETDFLGNSTTYQWNPARRLPMSVTEAAGKPEERVTLTTWHSQWRLPLTINHSGRITTYTYDSVGNPLTQAIADSASGVVRTTSWTYHPSGLVATMTAPNGAVSRYQYDSVGNLVMVTNALGQSDTYTHDAAGRVMSHTAANGLVSSYTYDARSRMLTMSMGGLLSQYTYHPTGQLASTTWPHGYSVSYQYDAAQRLIGWSDNRGASATYALDAMGNRIGEQIRDAQNHTVWQLVRSINGFNRVEGQTVGALDSTYYGYDANGNLVNATNALSETTSYGLDGLQRVQTLTNAQNATLRLSYNPRDAVTSVTDFKGVTTSYQRDSLGNAMKEQSPDSGIKQAQFDLLGLPSQVIDALGRTTSIIRDSLGRPTQIAHGAGAGASAQTITLRYDQSGAIGYLTQIVDASGTTTFQRDSLGRVTARTHTPSAGGQPTTVGYQWDATGQLASVTYPSGRVLQYQRDLTGRITALIWNGQPLVSNIVWNPLGLPTDWSWSLPAGSGIPGSSLSVSRIYDSAGRLTSSELGNWQYNAAGRIEFITQALWGPASTDPQQSSVREALASWSVQYDRVGRVIGMSRQDGIADSTSYLYDANGNRIGSMQQRASGSTQRTFQTSTSHNRLLGFEQIMSGPQGSATTTVSYLHDAAGNLLSDGLRNYQYDAAGRLRQVQVQGQATQYTYNALGQRVFKSDPIVTTASSVYGTTRDQQSNAALQLLGDNAEEDVVINDMDWSKRFAVWLRSLWSSPEENLSSKAMVWGWTYSHHEDGSLLAESPGAADDIDRTEHIWLPTANGPMPIAVVVQGRTYAVQADHLNTPRRLTQSDGKAAWQWAYSAFGDEAPTTLAQRFANELTIPSTGSTLELAVRYNPRFPGQYFDQESGLYYNWHRSYDSKTGRYTQSDPIGLGGGWNRFAYVGGNPLSYVDPNGLNPLAGAWAGAGAGSALGPVGTVVGGAIGAGVGAWIGWNVVGPMLIKPPENAYDPNGPKAPGKPGEAEGFKDPKGGENWVPNPNPGRGGSSWGWQDADGDVWCPSGQGGRSHGGPHWDVQTPGGGYRNERPRR